LVGVLLHLFQAGHHLCRRHVHWATRAESILTGEHDPSPRKYAKSKSPKPKKPLPEDTLCGVCNRHFSDSLLAAVCSRCAYAAHTNCLGFHPALKKVVGGRSDWLCGDCKVCHICDKQGDEDQMLLCDVCDNGLHLDCAYPKLLEIPAVNARCQDCLDTDGPTPTNSPEPGLPMALLSGPFALSETGSYSADEMMVDGVTITSSQGKKAKKAAAAAAAAAEGNGEGRVVGGLAAATPRATEWDAALCWDEDDELGWPSFHFREPKPVLPLPMAEDGGGGGGGAGSEPLTTGGTRSGRSRPLATAGGGAAAAERYQPSDEDMQLYKKARMELDDPEPVVAGASLLVVESPLVCFAACGLLLAPCLLLAERTLFGGVARSLNLPHSLGEQWDGRV
jgi:hypothetical protein